MKTLTKEHNSFLANRDPGTGNWSLSHDADGRSSNWSQPFANQGIFLSSTYFDLAGMSMDEKTLFFKGALVQDVLNPATTNSAPGDSIVVVDLMSVRPLSDLEVLAFVLNGNLSGLPSTTLTYHETVYGRIQQFVTTIDTASWGSMSLLASNQLGSMNPTASDRIYSYRLVQALGALTVLTVYGCRHLLAAEAKEEPDFEYLMRLKRSYELQQSYDED